MGLWLKVDASRRQNDPRKPDKVWRARVWGQKPGQPSKYGFCKQRKLLIFIFSCFFSTLVFGASFLTFDI